MYFIKDKSQLNSITKSIRQQLIDSYKFSLKPAKHKELFASCIGFNSYADLISKLPIESPDELDVMFIKTFSETVMAQPYGFHVAPLKLKAIYDEAISKHAYWDEELNYESIMMAVDGV